jgi:hypothetical protein
MARHNSRRTVRSRALRATRPGRVPRTVRTFPGKDAGLISSSKSNSNRERHRAPCQNCCARAARRVGHFAFCILHFAFCIPALAQTLSPPPAANSPTRLPATETPLQTAQLFPTPALPGQTVPAPQPAAPQRINFRTVKIFPRAEGMGPNLETFTTPQGEKGAILSGGVNIIIQGISGEGIPKMLGDVGDVDIEADRIVIWGLDLNSGPGGATQQSNEPLEVYMEGNIVFRQADRTIYADRMFYDARQYIGTILNAELLAPVPVTGPYQYPGLVRLRAAALRQLDRNHFLAQQGMFTTSRLEEPTYAVESDEITFEDLEQTIPDPVTGAPIIAHQRLARSTNNYVELGGIPFFYWPVLSTDLEKPSYYIDNFRFRHDSVFGYQALVELDAFQLLGMDRIQGVKWDIDLNYLSERGLGFGTGVEYARDNFFGLAGPNSGRFDANFISDHGHDNLGLDRRNIVPEEKFRDRIFWNHRQHLVGGLLDDWTVQAEVGFLSDRTFLEEYYENEWDNNKDQLTGVRLKRTYDNQAISIEANARVNDFFTQTQWLPRLDHYWLGEPLFGDNLTWFEHSSAAYANIGVASTPTNPVLASQFERLPWEEDSAGNPISGNGERLVTRQEIDWPIDAAPFKVVPFALGELGDWGQDINGDRFQRAYGKAGIRASIPFWYADPSIHDALLNLNGLAHKVVFDMEASWADSSQDLNRFPLYDELDDDSIEEFRRRLFFSPFGGPDFGTKLAGLYYVPGAPSFINPKFDPRFYALRTGMQDWVTAPSYEIADDLAMVRFGMHHRLQTKRGGPDDIHIVDWVTFDANATVFPDPNRDNFGQAVGQMDYDFKWHIGDRFSILSDGYADTFGDGLKTASIGTLLNRPARGNIYLGFRTIDGPFTADVLTLAVNYRTDPKWIISGSSSIDFGPTGNIGQSIAVTRIGESLIATLGANVDESKGSVGVQFLLEPRFLPNLHTTTKTGIEIPPVGAYGLE